MGPDQQQGNIVGPRNTVTEGDGMRFAIQNVRSLNISTKNDITLKKILAIVSLKTDIIFLSDIRINSDLQSSAIHDLKKHLFFNGYKLFHNSKTSSRGVGILVSKNITDLGFNILTQINRDDNNSLLLHVEIKGKQYILGAVYGPNHDDELEFLTT